MRAFPWNAVRLLAQALFNSSGAMSGASKARGASRRIKSTSEHSKAVMRNLVSSLFEHQRIETTVGRAKEAQVMAEKMITLGKKGALQHRRKALAYIRTESLVHRVFNEYAERYASRPGGYTRVIRTRNRYGDNAPMAMLELVDRPGEYQPHRCARHRTPFLPKRRNIPGRRSVLAALPSRKKRDDIQ